MIRKLSNVRLNTQPTFQSNRRDEVIKTIVEQSQEHKKFQDEADNASLLGFAIAIGTAFILVKSGLNAVADAIQEEAKNTPAAVVDTLKTDSCVIKKLH